MNKYALSVVLSMMFVSLPIRAVDNIQKENDIEQVFKVAKMHAKISACSTSFDENENGEVSSTTEDIFLIEDDGVFSTYYVSWDGDLGCGGGSGAYSHIFTVIQKAIGAQYGYIVINDDAFNVNQKKESEGFFNPRFVESVKQISMDKFEIISSDYDSPQCNDAGSTSAASAKYKYLIAKDNGIDWVLEQKQFIACVNE